MFSLSYPEVPTDHAARLARMRRLGAALDEAQDQAQRVCRAVTAGAREAQRAALNDGDSGQSTRPKS